MSELKLDNEVFALRDGEVAETSMDRPTDGEWIAVMLRSVKFPEGEHEPFRESDGVPVEMCAVLACHLVRDKWQWLQLSPQTKERVGDLFFDSNAPRDQWLYLKIRKVPKKEIVF